MSDAPAWVDVPSRAAAPEEWPAAVPFIPNRAARLYRANSAVVIRWPIAPGVSTTDPEARTAHATMMDPAAPVTGVLSWWRRLTALLGRPAASPAGETVRVLLEDLAQAAEALGYTRQPSKMPRLLPWLEMRRFVRGGMSMQVMAQQGGDEPGVTVMVQGVPTTP